MRLLVRPESVLLGPDLIGPDMAPACMQGLREDCSSRLQKQRESGTDHRQAEHWGHGRMARQAVAEAVCWLAAAQQLLYA